MKLEFVNDPPIVLGLDALAQLLVQRGDLALYGGKLGKAELEGGTFCVEVLFDGFPPEKRRWTKLTLQDLRDVLSGCVFCTWARDEDGNDVLACFN